MNKALSTMPLAKWLGAQQYGEYGQAPNNTQHAFVPLAEMWQEDVNADSSDSDEDDDPNTYKTPPSAATEAMALEPPAQLPLKRALNKLYNDIWDSQDRLFFVRLNRDSTWKLAQVDLDATDPRAAKTFGQYKVQWWTPSLTDRKSLVVRECRFTPDVRTVRADGTLGRRHPIKHERIDRALASDPTIRWMSDTINLTEDMITGPFNFDLVRTAPRGQKRTVRPESHHINDIYWNQLERNGPMLNIPTDNIHAHITHDDAL